MMLYVVLLTVAGMVLLTSSKKLPDFNYILRQYVAVCGVQLCNISSAALPYVDRKITDLPSMCPPCRCDDCILHMDCCPDIEIDLYKLKCENDVVYSPFDIGSKFYFSVLDSCPEKSDKKFVQLCQNRTDLIDKLTLNPVTSVSGKTYRNVYCAQCNGERDYQSWSLDIKCNGFVDFNFLSSFEEIGNLVKEKRCTVLYNHDSVSYKIQRCEPSKSDLIGRCNMTGSWNSYDYDIELACNIFHSPVDAYKNIYCFLCNPPILEKENIIAKCNQTGIWSNNFEALQNACLLYNESSATYPFKNIFCYYCNKGKGTYGYTDIAGKCITSVQDNESELSYKIINGVFTSDFILQYVGGDDATQATNQRLNTSFVFYDDEREVNMLNLLNLYESVYGSTTCGIYTSDRTVPPYDCLCFPDCLAGRTCCIDFELDNRWVCTNNRVMSNTCRYSNINFNENCYKRGEMRYDLPVYVVETKQHYANVYCALCADEFLNSLKRSIQFIRPWNIKITCPVTKPLAVHYQLAVTAVIKLGKERNCALLFEPEIDEIIPCDDTTKTINTCNTTGAWLETDEDVLWACERLDTIYLTSFMGFRNVFCSLCNPDIVPREPDTTTTHPRETTTAIPTPCRICLTDNKNIMFRTLFQLSYEEDDTISQCRIGQFLDILQNKCRNVTCSPGYMLVNLSCEPLLLSTGNLGYIMPLRLETVSAINPVENRDFLEDIEFSIQIFLYQYLELKRLPRFASVYMVTNTSCNSNEATKMKIFATVEFYIAENVLRMEVETKLVNFHNKSLTTGKDETNMLTMTFDQSAINTKTIINNRAQFTGNCYFSNSEFQRSNQFYRFIPVSELLLCKQVSLEDDEVRIDHTASTVTFKSNGIEITQGKFMFDDDETIRVCVDTLKSFAKHSPPVDPVIQTVNFVAMALSMVCLFLTFLTYSLFSVLRSIPGKNNMSLVVSYFFLQIVLIIGSTLYESDIFCEIFGILLHYFLLTSFTCLNVCTVHMFKAFRGIHLPHSTEHDNRTFLYYTLYAYCSPILVIVTNISVTMSLSNETGYGNRGTLCFITNPYVTLTSVIVPVSVICVCNAVFFIMTMHQIRSTPKIERSGNHASIRRNSVVYVKLFSLTGVTWGIQIIDAFLPVSYLSIIASLCNSLQGVYIFISYICNARVLNMYKNILKCYYKESNSSASKPPDTFSSDANTRGNT